MVWQSRSLYTFSPAFDSFMTAVLSKRRHVADNSAFALGLSSAAASNAILSLLLFRDPKPYQ